MACKKLPIEQPEPLLGSRYFQRKYNVSPVTVWRWQKSGRLPAPDAVIGGHNFWNPGTRPLSDNEMAARKHGDAA